MKYISFALFLLALAWSWSMFYENQGLDFKTHALIQIELEEIIRKAIEEGRPEAENLRFHKLWTEDVSANQIRAHFKYSFIDSVSDNERIEQTIQGTGILSRLPEDSQDNPSWSLEVNVDGDEMAFQKGLVVTPDSK